MKLALLTPTGDRPEAFALCQRWIKRQTRKPDYWFITDDGTSETASGVLENCEVWGTMRRLDLWDKPGTSQHRNMLELLKMAEESDADAFVVIEDDDWYGPHYIENCARHLETHELIGEKPARYYNVKTRHWRVFQNNAHASLCQTAFRRSMIQPLREVCVSGQWIDMTFWPKYFNRGLLWEGHNVVGIKGMPGRGGISNAHRETAKWGHHDPDLAKLREWIGNDAEVYAEYVERDAFTPVGDVRRINGPTNWCASCGLATVENDGDTCERCQSTGAEQLQIKTFTWGKPGREITMYRCPNAGCRFDASTVESVVKHLRGCAERKVEPEIERGVGLFGPDGKQI